MNKYLLAVVTVAAFSGMSFAQPAAAPAAAPAVKAEKPAAKKEVAKKVEVTNGEISAIDAATNEITVVYAGSTNNFSSIPSGWYRIVARKWNP